MKTFLKKLTTEEMQVLTSHHTPQSFSDETEIFPTDQVAEGAAILVEGEFQILKNDEACLIMPPGYILGLRQLLNGEPWQLHCRPCQGSKAIVLRKKDVEEAQDQNSPLHSILKKFIA
jgi:CRP-like cAMP-binding protein